ncbi:TPA: tagatose-bisphosphate aldolase [Patescibacteria group bacterium]|nr:tagatose-bisphosphate aldolase [Patescibacteria group bacterium]
MNLKDYLDKAVQTKTAVGHFNVSNWEGIKAIREVCFELKAPIVIGLSQGEAEFMGIDEVAEVVKFYKNTYKLPVFLNADHFNNLDLVQQATLAGFDSILFDAAGSSLEENIEKTKEAVDLVRAYDPRILVEGELGYIGVGSIVRESVPEGAVVNEAQMITPQQAKEFVEKTGVDLIGPGVGNIHGIVKGYKENLSFQRIAEVKAATPAFLVLHGASGVDNDSVKQAIQAGISVVHVNTELRLAWKNALQKSLADSPEEIAPYKVLAPSVEAIKAVIKEKIGIFG